MGVKRLNHFLRTNCVRGIRHMDLRMLAGKHVVVDAMNYMYKLKFCDMLHNNMNRFLTIFSRNNIRLTFVFDGKPPDLKRPEIEERRQKKINARKALVGETDPVRIHRLKRTCVSINHLDMVDVKEQLKRWAIPFVTAQGESDGLCASMVIGGEADACLSDDMDMLVHGCPLVLRNFNLSTHTVTAYDLPTMLAYLQVPPADFTKMCVLAGTDYYRHTKLSLQGVWSMYKDFAGPECFLEWVGEKRGLDLRLLNEVFSMYHRNDCRQLI